MWWNGLWIHSISSESPSVVHDLYSYWCFHSSCNILAFCLPSFNSNDRSADKSFCITILMVIASGYLKKYHKNNIIKLKAFCFPQIKSVHIFLRTNDQRFHQQIANVFPYISVTHGFANEIQFSVFIYFDPSLRNLASSWHQGKLIWITGNNCFRVQFILCRAFGFAHHWRRLFFLWITFPSKLGFVYYWEIFG